MPLNYVEFQGKQPILNFDLVSPLRAGQQDALAQKEFLLRSEASQRDAELQPLRMEGMKSENKLRGFQTQEAEMLQAPGENGGPSLLQRDREATIQNKEVDYQLKKKQVTEAAKSELRPIASDITRAISEGNLIHAKGLHDLLKQYVDGMKKGIPNPELDAFVMSIDPSNPELQEVARKERLSKVEENAALGARTKALQFEDAFARYQTEKDPEKKAALRQQVFSSSGEESIMGYSPKTWATKSERLENYNRYVQIDSEDVQNRVRLEKSKWTKGGTVSERYDTVARIIGQNAGFGSWSELVSEMENGMELTLMQNPNFVNKFPDPESRKLAVKAALNSYGASLNQLTMKGSDAKVVEDALKKTIEFEKLQLGFTKPSDYVKLLGVMRSTWTDTFANVNDLWVNTVRK